VIAAALSPRLRPMLTDDLDAVLVIERAVYPHGWSAAIFGDCLRVGYDCWLLLDGKALAGYAVMSVAVGEAHLLNIAIAPTHQRQGLGALLLRHLLYLAQQRSAQTLFLEVRPSNHAARTLYEQFGFNQIGVRRGYYPAAAGQSREDAWLYALDLSCYG